MPATTSPSDSGAGAACHSIIGCPDTSRFGASDTNPALVPAIDAIAASSGSTWLRGNSRSAGRVAAAALMAHARI